MEDDVGALNHWRYLLRPGGGLVLRVLAYQRKFGPVDELVAHHRRYDPNPLTRLFERAGFERVTVRVYRYPIGYPIRPVQGVVARRRVISDSWEPRTTGDGQLLQPASAWQEAVTVAVAGPFRLLQRVAPARRRGSGLVANAGARG